MGSLTSRRQATLKRRVRLAGIGVHSGRPAAVTLTPADPGAGIVFIRTGLAETLEAEIPARASLTGATRLSTTLQNRAGISVATVEHLLAAFSGLGVDNATVEVEGPEVPIMDGSAGPFVEAILSAGIVAQPAPKRVIRVKKTVRVEFGDAVAEFCPHPGRRFEIGIAFDCPVVRAQSIGVELTPRRFRKDIARARTFGHIKDVEGLWADGLALGASPDNTVVIGEGAVLNPEGLRWPDEFVRHKLLDAIGDLALAGAPIEGLYRSFRGGHRLNAAAVAALIADRAAWGWASAEPPASPSRGRLAAPMALAPDAS
jgi:UDP-3-O-[3-hydroxymyristoyl] N-acetylglucosamine deacetylase